MCVQCLRDYKAEIDRMAGEIEGDPLIPDARQVLTLMCQGDLEYARTMKMIAIFFAQYPGACDQLLLDVSHLRSEMIAADKLLNPSEQDQQLKDFPGVKH